MPSPAVGALSGALAEAGRKQSGTTGVTAHATDAGGGVAAFALDVDGRQVSAAAAPGCPAEPFTAPTPCPTDISQTLELDTAKLGYRLEVRVTATDRSVQRRSFAIRRGKAPKRVGRCRTGDAGARYHACS